MNVPGKTSHRRWILFACLVVYSILAGDAWSAPFKYVRTLQISGESSFGRALAEFNGNLLVGASGKAYLYDLESAALLQAYDHAGGAFNGGNWITAHGEKIAIGTPGGTGFVQVFNATTGQLLQTHRGSETGDRFGWSLASNGQTLFVGAPELRNGFTYYGQGKVVAIDSIGNRRTILNPEPMPQPSNEESFGYDIGVIGNDLYVGALYDSEGGKVWHIAADSGATLRKYDNPHGTLGNANRPQFGNSLDVEGNYLLIGANQSSASGTSASGAAYLYDRFNGNLLHTLFDPVPGVLHNFGSDVALLGDFAVIGAHNDGDGKSNGAVFVFDINTGRHVQTLETPFSSSHFFGLKVQRVGQNWLAVSETPDGGKVHVYAVVPEPTSFTMIVAIVVASMQRRRCATAINRKTVA